MTHFSSQTSLLHFEMLPWQQITKGTSQNLAPKKSEKSAICKNLELKFGIETKFGSLSLKNQINLRSDIIMTF